MNIIKKIAIKPAYELQKRCNFIKRTPLEFSERLSKLYNCNIFLKREDLQTTRSFKIRGSYNKIMNISNTKQCSGIVTASAGNHAQGVAYICNKLKIKNHIFVPNITPLQKINRIKTIGKQYCNLKIIGDTFDDALNNAMEFTEKYNKSFVHPFDDFDVIAGQGVIGYEILEELNPDIIVSTIGGGGLISGLYTSFYENNLNTTMYGIEPKGAMSMCKSIERNNIVKLDNINNFVDGASVKEVGKNTFSIIKDKLKKIYGICNNELCYDIIQLYQEEGIISEPAGALSVSGLRHIDKDEIKGKNVVCIISGGNNDIKRYNEFLEKSLLYQDLKHYFLIEFTQKPGQLKNFVKNILGEDDDIALFEYIKKTEKSKGTALIGIELSNKNNIKNILKNLELNNYKFQKINEDDLLYSYLV